MLEKLKAVYTSNAFLKSTIVILSVFTSLLLSFISYRVYIELEYKDLILNLKHINPNTTSLIEERVSDPASRDSIDLDWIYYSDIPELMKTTVTETEDPTFFSHSGFDFHSIILAIKENADSGRIVNGASTISQQLSKNLFLTTSKTFQRKIDEAFITILIEKHLCKERIIELYLNVAEFGPGIFGVRNASRVYFKKEVYQLTNEEIIRLIVILPKPSSVRPTENNKWLIEKASTVLESLKDRGVITKNDYHITFNSLHDINL